MKTKISKYFLAFVFLNAYISKAEIDTFDMSLTGRFDSDYCELSQNYSIRYDIDVATVFKQQKENDFYFVGTNSIFVSCSGGLYDIALSTTSPTKVKDAGDGFIYRHSAYSYVGERLEQPGIQTQPDALSSSAHLHLRDVEFHPTFGGIAKFQVGAYAFPKNGVWDELPDSFNHTETIVITIDKKD